MAKKGGPDREKKRQKKAMDKRRKDAERHKKAAPIVSENAAKYQMMTRFGRPGQMDNFLKSLAHLSEMFGTEDDLKDLRFDAAKLYEGFDLAADREPLARLYAAENALFVPEDDGDFWKAKREALLPAVLTTEFAKKVGQRMNVLLLKKKGFKKEVHAAQAGKLLADAHVASLTGGDAGDNALWELIFNVTLRENQRELPPAPEPVVPEPAASESTGPESTAGALSDPPAGESTPKDE
jgi:hypothetical protein